MREMKDSGVPWIGDIPKGWETIRIKQVSRVIRGGSPRPIEEYLSDTGFNWIKIGDTQKGIKYIYSTKQKIRVEGLTKTRLVHHGDLLLTNSMSFGEPYILKTDGCIHDGWVAIMNINAAVKEYLYYALASEVCKVQFELQVAGGVVQNLNIDKIGATFIPYPSVAEQQRIADVLDAKCAEIDAILEKTRASIEDYKKLKQAVITEAVTKGIRGDRPMKDSGVEWIGMIPTDWIICRVKHVLVSGKEGIKIGPFGSSLTNKVDGDGAYKVYGQWNIVDKDFSAGKNYVSADTFHELNAYQVFPGDVLISMMGTIGKCATIPEGICEGIMDSHVIKARLNENKITSRFFELIYDKDNSSFIFDQMQVKKKGSIMDGLNSTIVKNLFLTLPPLPEQQIIAAYLDEKCATIDSLIASKEALITELEAYKKSIIYEYVTGKKEVPAV